jgi:sugar phosphate isomerase/epimerase
VIIAATTACFPQLPLSEAIELLSDLEFTCIEIALHDDSQQMPTHRLEEDFLESLRVIRDTHRLDICNYDLRIEASGEGYYERFRLACQLAKATKVVTLTVPSAVQGTPFNEEIEHLKRLVEIAEGDGLRVGIRSQIGRLSEDPDTVKNICDYVPGIGLALDPSQYHCSPNRNKNYDRLMKHVFHVHLRDSKKDQIQVRVGQGEIEYGRLITQLQRAGYDRALSIDIIPMEGLDTRQELRKLRLLLESLL